MSITGNIYCITCLTTGEKYIGSTSKNIEVRLEQHRNPFNQCSSRQIIQTMLTDKKREVYALERKWIETHRDKAINKNIPCQTPEEKRAYMRAYEKENAEYYKAYRDAHKDKWHSKICSFKDCKTSQIIQLCRNLKRLACICKNTKRLICACLSYVYRFFLCIKVSDKDWNPINHYS